MALGLPQGRPRPRVPNGQGRVQMHSNIVNRGFSPLLVDLGIVDEAGKAGYGFHCLRHFFASLMIDQ
jgi:hypothetical protein